MNKYINIIEHHCTHRNFSIVFITTLYLIAYLACIHADWITSNFIVLDTPKLNDILSNNNSMNEIFGAIFSITMVIIGFIFTELKSKPFVTFDFLTTKTFLFPIFYSSLINIGMMLFTTFYYSLAGCNILDQPCIQIHNVVLLNFYFVIINIIAICFLFRRVVRYMDSKEVIKTFADYFLNIANDILNAESKSLKLKQQASLKNVENSFFENSFKGVKVDDYNKILNDLKSKLIQACKEENHMQSAEVLNIIEKAYLNIFQINKTIKNHSLKIGNSLAVQGVEKEIINSSKISFKNENFEIINRQLLPFISTIIRESIISESFLIYRQYVSLLKQTYIIASEFDDKISIGVKEYVSLRLKEIYLWNLKIYIDQLILEEEKNQFVRLYFYYLLAEYNNHLKDALNKRDFKTYRYAANEFYINIFEPNHYNDYQYLESDNLKPNNEILLTYYIDNIVFYQYSWIILLYEERKISAQTAKEYLDQHKINFYSFEVFLDSLLYLFQEGYNNNLGTGNWEDEIIERMNGVVYSPLDTKDWVATGMIIFLIKNSNIIPAEIDSEKIKSISTSFGYYAETLINKLNQIEEHLTDWLPLLGNRSLHANEVTDSYLQTIVYVREKLNDIFIILRKEEFIRENQILVNQNISSEKRNEFVKWVGETWYKRSALHKIFDHYQNIKELPSCNLKWIGDNLNIAGAKMMFIEEGHKHIYGASNVGGTVADREDLYFLEQIKKTTIAEYENILGCLDSLISKLKIGEYNPDVIFLSYKWKYSKMQFVNNPDFKFIKNDDSKFINMGFYKGIPCICSYNKVWDDYILVADFKKSFTLEQERNIDWFMEQLRVDIRTVTDEEANEIYTKNPLRWSKTNEGLNLTREEAIEYNIKTSIHWEIGVNENFKVEDENAYELAKISI